jgi:hypothetical protein
VKYKIPEIFLGAWMAVAIFAMGLVVSSAWRTSQPIHTQSSEPASHEAKKGELPQSFWERTTTDPVAFFTLVMAGLTGVIVVANVGLWIVTVWTLRHSKEFAERQLRAHFLLEEIKIGGVEDIRASGIACSPRLTYVLKNAGGGPGWLREPLFKLDLRRSDDGLPSKPDFSEPRATISTFVPILPGASRPTYESFEVPGFTITPEEASELLLKECGNLHLTVYGYIKYSDTFTEHGSLRFSGFCYQYRFGEHVAVPANASRYWRYE